MSARVATPSDLDTLVEIMTLAFADDPVWGHALRPPDRLPDDMREFWRLWLDGALRYPWTWLWNEGEAASVWIPPGGTEMSDAQAAEFEALAVRRLGRDGAAYLSAVTALFEANHPHGKPHYYLSLLATHPAHRGRGAGMALLADNLGRIDAEHRPAYLESSNPANDHRYARMGFVPNGSFQLPNHGPLVTTMWRAAALTDPGEGQGAA
jgi:GNAT superfamily N-acetyltransferase